jgi:hypothetical protein
LQQKRTRKICIADIDGGYEKIPKRSIWYGMREWRAATLTDDALAARYSPGCRPSIPPSLKCSPSTFIQVRLGWSDPEAVHNAYFDDGVTFALSPGRVPEIACSHSTVWTCRVRLLESGLGRQVLRHARTQPPRWAFWG